MISNFKMLSSPRKLSKGGFRIDPSQFPRYSMYKHTTVQKLNGSKKVTVGVWASTTQTPHTPGFIPNFHWYRTTDKSSYSNRNSAKQVPQIEGLPEQQQQQSQLQSSDLVWLYPDLFCTVDSKTTVPEMGLIGVMAS